MIIPFVVFRTFEILSSFFAFFPALIGLIVELIIRVITKKYKTN